MSRPRRWRKTRVCSGSVEHHLYQGDKRLAVVAFAVERRGWYWYGNGHNSLLAEQADRRTWATPELAKADARAHLDAVAS